MGDPQGILHAIQHGLHIGESIHALAAVHPGDAIAAGSTGISNTRQPSIVFSAAFTEDFPADAAPSGLRDS